MSKADEIEREQRLQLLAVAQGIGIANKKWEKEFSKLERYISESLLHSLSEHWNLQAIVLAANLGSESLQGLDEMYGITFTTLGQMLDFHYYDLHGMALYEMPLARFAHCLAPKFNHVVAKQQQLQDPSNMAKVKNLVMKWLRDAGTDKDTIEELKPLLEDEERCIKLAELLIMTGKYPTRCDLMLVEAFENLFQVRRGSLQNEVTLGRRHNLKVSIDMFLEALETEVSKGPSSAQPPQMEKGYVHLLWKMADIDGDGSFSEDESIELVRLVLCSPVFGILLTTFCVNNCQKANQHWDRIRRVIFISLIPSIVRAFAKFGVQGLSSSLWRRMDKDGDGAISEDEFKHLFLVALWQVLVIPATSLVATRISDVSNAFDAPKPKKRFFGQSHGKSYQNCGGRRYRDCTGVGKVLFTDCLLESKPAPSNLVETSKIPEGSKRTSLTKSQAERAEEMPTEFLIAEHPGCQEEEAVLRMVVDAPKCSEQKSCSKNPCSVM